MNNGVDRSGVIYLDERSSMPMNRGEVKGSLQIIQVNTMTNKQSSFLDANE